VFKSSTTEPYSIITFSPAELYYVERHIFLECIGDSDYAEYMKAKTYFPPDTELRKKYYHNTHWTQFKHENILTK